MVDAYVHSGLCVISALVGGMLLSPIVCLSLFVCGHVCVSCGYGTDIGV